MTTLAEFMLLSGTDNRPPMLDKDLYDSWKSRMELYMQNREHGRMILESVEHGPLIWPTIEENGMTKTKKYEELSATEKIQADCDLKATNIILQGLPSDVYLLVNHHRVAKDLWEIIQLLMQGTSLTKQERECKLYDAFDKFAYIKGESLHQYYLRFTQSINDMNIYKMKLEQFQVNTKFLNSLPSEWNKFVTDVKLVKDLHTTNFDQLNEYLEQHELHANEIRIMREHSQDQHALVIDSGLAVPVFKQRDEHIDAINKMMSFLTTVVTSRFPSTNNQLRNSSNPRQQATTHDGRVTVQPVQGRQNSFTAAQGYGKVLNEEELTFLADPKVAEGPVTQTVITYNAVYQADDLDAYDSYYDDISTAKAVLMANLSSFGSDVLSEVPHSENNHNDMLNQSVQEIPYSEETYLVNYPENEITSDSNIIPYFNSICCSGYKFFCTTRCHDIIYFVDFEKEINYLKQTLFEQLKEKELLIETFNVLKNKSKEKETKNIDKEIALEQEINDWTISVFIKWVNPHKLCICSRDNNLKQALGFQNPFYLKKAQQIRPMLYDGSIIAKEKNVISIADSEETMMLEGESRSKMLLKQKLSDEQAFLLQTSHPNTDQSASSSVKIEVPRELPKNGNGDMNTSVNVNSPVAMNDSVNYVEKCNKCLELEAELIKQHNMVEKDKYNRLSKSFSKLEQHCISLELAMQLNKENFQRNNTSANQTKPAFDHLFELNNLKAKLQAKDTTIKKLKENIKCLNKTSTTNSVKNDIDEIETINIKLEHRVAKLITENEHLKQTYKQLYDLIKPSRVCAKEHAESLVNRLNKKSVKIIDLNAQLQEKVFVITALKIILVTLAPKDKNNKETHIYYLKHTMERVAILREIVEQAKSLNPLDSASYSAHNFMFDARHELCFLEFVSDMNACFKSKIVKKAKKKEEWKPTGKVITATNEVPLREPIPLEVVAQEPIVTKVYTSRPKVVQIVLWYLDSGCSKHMTGDRSQLTNFVHKFLDLEVAFKKHTCSVRNLEGVDLLSRSREIDLYTLSIGDMMASSLICLLSKASKTKSWLWHRRLSHLNFGVINHLAKNGLVRGLPKLKFEKDQLCSACAMGKSKKQSHKPKSEDTNQEKLYLLHMDLCRPMRVASINGKKYILVIVDDCSRFTW
ncbi:retrovirus-related pol polyprotein from transposon TNT 1-94 [Tanacetum coccineum]